MQSLFPRVENFKEKGNLVSLFTMSRGVWEVEFLASFR